MHSLSNMPKAAAALAVVVLLLGCALGASAQGNSGFAMSGSGYAIYRVNTLTNGVTTLTSTISPAYLGALSPRGTQLWVESGDGLSVYRTTSGTLLFRSGYIYASRPVFSLEGDRAYYMTGNYPMALVARDTATFARTDSFVIASSSYPQARPVLSSDGTRLYCTDYNYLYEIDLRTGAILRRVSVYGITRLAVNPSGTRLYGVYGSTLYVFDLGGLTLVGTVSLGGSVGGMELSRDGGTIYVTNSSSWTITSVDAATFEKTTRPLSTYGMEIALAPSDTILYIATPNYGSNNLLLYNTHTDSMIGALSVPNSVYGVVMPPPADPTPPATIADLQVSALRYNTARLLFTAPGDDGNTGSSRYYTVRYDTIPVTAGNFSSAPRFFPSRAPRPGGTSDTIDIGGLRPNTTYYFAMTASDEVLNASGLAAGSVALPLPPVAVVGPDSFALSAGDFDSVSVNLAIGNTGGSDLHYQVRFLGAVRQDPEAPAARTAPLPPSEPSERASTAVACALAGSEIPWQAPASANAPPEMPAALSATGPRVLILHAEQLSAALDVVTKIRAKGSFSVVDTFDLRVGTPTLEHLRKYEGVFLWLNYSAANLEALGNVLADYVDQGGGLVLAVYALALNGSYSTPFIGGRFNSANYWVLRPGSTSSNHDNLALGTVFLPDHPVMRGVTTFFGNHSFRVLSPSLVSGGTKIAAWSDGSTLVATRVVSSGRRVDLNMYPPSSDINIGEYWESSTDGAKLMANALTYVASGVGLRASIAPDAGTVAPAAEQSVAVKLVTSGARAGNYLVTFEVATDDPATPVVAVRASLAVSDRTPPHMAVRFFQNEELTQYVTVVGVAGELLFAPSMKLSVGTDTTLVALTLGDSVHHVYSGSYKMTAAGVLSATFAAIDSVGNRMVVSRSMAATSISPSTAATVESPLGEAALALPDGAVGRTLYLTCQAASEAAAPEAGMIPVGEAYAYGPQSEPLLRRAELRLRVDPSALAPGAAEHLAVFRWTAQGGWTALPSRVDPAGRAVLASVDAFGTYRVCADPSVRSEVVTQEVPASYRMDQNYPNPFNPSTTIRYGLAASGEIALVVTNLLGQEVATIARGYRQAGFHEATWDGLGATGAPASSGIYFYRLTAGAVTLTGKMLLMK
jgi:hypothetical protein